MIGKRFHRSLCALLLALTWACAATAGPAGPVQWTGTTTVKASGAAWGRMAALGHGCWLMVYTVFPAGGPSELRIARSDDRARSWTVIARVAEPGRTLDNGNLVRLPNGTMLLTMRSLISGQSYRLPVYRSTDQGRHWHYLSTVAANEHPDGRTNRGLWEPSFNVLPDGRISVLYADETLADATPSYSQVISQRVSTDGGASWGSVTHAVEQPGGGAGRPGMPVMARMADGRYILAFEVCGFGPCDVAYKLSADGVTWPSGLGTGIHYQRCGPYIMSTRDGRLLITSCQNEVSYSNDDGGDWMKNDPAAWPIGFSYTWPAIYQTGKNEVAVLNGGDGGALKIRFGTLSPASSGSRDFFDDFTDGDDAGWSRYGENFHVADGVYRADNAPGQGNASSKALAGDDTWTSGTLQADVRIDSANNAGLMFRVTNGGFGPDEAFGYYLGLDTSGNVTLGRQANAWTTLASVPANVAAGAWHHVKIVYDGPRITVYVDDMDTPLIQTRDTTFTHGQIGVRSHYADASFDNVRFTRALHTDSFSDDHDDGWTLYGGKAAVREGSYWLNDAFGSGKSLWVTPGRDMTLEADVSPGFGHGNAGVVFRASAPGVGAMALHGYYAGLVPAGNKLVVGRLDGGWTELGSASVPQHPFGRHHVKVVAIGDEMRIYVDDMHTPKLHVHDTAWQAGAVGVQAQYMNAAFDDLRVTH